MEDSKPEIHSASRAHDQETQTSFDMSHIPPNGTSSNDGRRAQGYHPNNPNNHRHGQQLQWSANHGFHSSGYPEYYPYELRYTHHHHPPPSISGPPLHGNHYYPGRMPPWHNSSSPVLPSHISPVPHPYSSYHHYQYHPSDGFYAHPPLHGVAPPMPISRERRHTDLEIARPKAEWPPGYQPFAKPIIPSDYLALLHRNPGSDYGVPPSTATSLRSTVIDLPPSNFQSPRPSARMTRKRPLSSTASSVESIDLNALIRGSPDSLSGYLGPTRVSSAGSFGHLSPIAFCTSPGSRQARYPIARNVVITTPPIAPPRILSPSSMQDALPSSTTGAEGTKEETQENTSCAESPKMTNNKEPESASSKEENMDICPLDSTTSPGASEVKQEGSDNEADDNLPEQEEQDLVCHWKECCNQCETQDELVRHVNNDHIKKDRKDFTCYWDGCTRERKPFKAQYMLVVHMRRHTGEKPHKCNYEGCSKAYSRLENLKTHLRSHTGERPYVCEVEGCNKAFSNASDRAKHQNRTHSSVKPYVCKVPGCPKRYTDPSSLRKHTKTVHGEQAIKRLKAEGGREKPSSNPDKKGSVPPDKGQGLTMATVTQCAQSPSSATTDQTQEPSSPGRDGSSAVGSVYQGGSCSQTLVGSSFEGDTVSSSCDRIPGGLDIPSSQGSPRSAAGQSTIGLSPRSPPFVSHLPDILEGEWESNDGGAVSTVQSVGIRPPHQGVTLPKLDVHKRDVASWVNDVHRRMSQSSRRSSEGSHLSVELNGDSSRRSSQESGWSSYGSRRSSRASPFPSTSIQPQEVIPHYPNGAVLPLPPQCRPPHLNSLDTSDDVIRRTSETSTCSNQSVPYNRLSRNSSGYGSQSNLAVIRSPMFHKIPPPSSLLPQRTVCADAASRRKSDTVICEADSSGSYLQNSGKGEVRRSSEPIRQARALLTRIEPPTAVSNRVAAMPNVSETGLMCGDVDPQEFDAYLNPQEEGQVESAIPYPLPQQTQRLCHFPYPEEHATQPPLPHPPISQTTIHHRPQPFTPHQPNPSNHGHQGKFASSDANGAPAPRIPQRGHWPPPRYRPGGQQQAPIMQNGLNHTPSESGISHIPSEHSGERSQYDMVNYEDAMVAGLGLLSTENGGVSEFVGNNNMVVNDMNTLLNSLHEEERYLELCQSRGVTGSAMSIF